MNTGERNRHGRVIFQGARGGRYTVVGGRRQYVAAAPAAPPAAPPAVPLGYRRVTVNGRNWVVDTHGRIRAPNMSRQTLGWNQIEKILNRVARVHPGHVNQKNLPYASRTLPVNHAHSPTIQSTEVFVNSSNQTNRNARVYYKPTTEQLYYRRANGTFVNASSDQVPHGLRLYPGGRTRVLGEVRLLMSPRINEHGTFIVPGGSPRSLPRFHGPRSNAELLNNMTQQIFSYGNINTVRYTNDEKQRLSAKMKNKIQSLRNKYKANKAAGKNEKIYGIARNQVRAYMRGYAALNPLSGKVKSPRIRNETPNRWSPAPIPTNFVSLENLRRPHLVVKQRGVETFYLNPNSIVGIIKAGSGANIKEEDLRNWLRHMRRNMPNAPLFRNPADKKKYVKAKHIRFSRE